MTSESSEILTQMELKAYVEQLLYWAILWDRIPLETKMAFSKAFKTKSLDKALQPIAPSRCSEG